MEAMPANIPRAHDDKAILMYTGCSGFGAPKMAPLATLGDPNPPIWSYAKRKAVPNDDGSHITSSLRFGFKILRTCVSSRVTPVCDKTRIKMMMVR